MDWHGLRHQFPVTENYAFLDHAAVAPIPDCAAGAMRAFLEDVSRHGDVNEPQWQRHVERVRGMAATLIGAKKEEVAFVKNTTEGICHVANGLRWEPGDNVVITNVEFPANVYPWLNLERRGLEVRWVEEAEGRIPFESIEAAIDARTKLLSISFVEFMSGFRNDLPRLGELCRKRGVLFCVDAIQGLGALWLDVREAKVDFLSADGHKWLLAPEGAGVFFCDAQAMDKIDVSEAGWMAVVDRSNYADYDFTLRPDASRFECGSLNTLGIYGLGASIHMLLDIGIDQVERRIMNLTGYLCEGLRSAGCRIYSSLQPGERSGIVTFVPPDDPAALHRRLLDAGVIVSLRNGMIRVAPHCYNNPADIDRLLETL